MRAQQPDHNQGQWPTGYSSLRAHAVGYISLVRPDRKGSALFETDIRGSTADLDVDPPKQAGTAPCCMLTSARLVYIAGDTGRFMGVA